MAEVADSACDSFGHFRSSYVLSHADNHITITEKKNAVVSLHIP